MYHRSLSFLFFFFNDTATTEIYTLSLHDALPISPRRRGGRRRSRRRRSACPDPPRPRGTRRAPRGRASSAPSAWGVVALHETLATSVAEVAARAPEPLLEQRAGHQRARDHEPRRMELHHLHVA